MSNHTGALRMQAQHTSNLNTFYTSWSVFLIRAETDPTQISLAICEPYNFTIQDQEDKNSDRTDDRGSVTPSSWMKLVLDKQSAALGREAHHDKLTTVVRRHPAKRNDQERSHNEKTLLDCCSEPRKQVALSGKTTQNESFLTRESPNLTTCDLHGCNIFLLRDSDPVADGHAYQGNPREHTRHKITTH